jgi:uncharacterized repeat protein (TIGR01451 family)
LTVTEKPAAGSYYYRVTVQTANTCSPTVVSTPATVTVREAFSPGVFQVPTGSICPGAIPAAITGVSAPTGGDGQYSYQWYKDGGEISGATGATYRPEISHDEGAVIVYTRGAKDGLCATEVRAGSYTLTVSSALTSTINLMPAVQGVCNSASFTITSGEPEDALGYTWQKWDGSDWKVITGQTDKTLHVDNNTTEGDYYYKVTVLTGSTCSQIVTSTPATVTVYPAFSAGAFEDGSGGEVCVNGVPDAITADIQKTPPTGSGSYTYAWYRNGTELVSTSEYFTPSPETVAGAVTYTRKVFGGTCGEDWTSGSYILQVNAEPTVTLSAVSTTVCYDTPATIFITDPVDGATYTWYSSPGGSVWTEEAVTTSNSYTTGNLTAATTLFRVKVAVSSETCPLMLSAPITITLKQEEPELICNQWIHRIEISDDACSIVIADNLHDDRYVNNGTCYTFSNNKNDSPTLKGATFDIGAHTVTWTVTYTNGSTATCDMPLTVIDKHAPDITACKDTVLALDVNGAASITAEELVTADDCSKPLTYAFVNIGPTITYTCTQAGGYTYTVGVIDAAANPMATCNVAVTVVDTLPPQFTVNNPIPIKVGETLTPEKVITAESLSDNCTSSTYMLDPANSRIQITPNTFTCDDIGDVPATITVSDKADNSTSYTFTVRVEAKDPVITCAASATVLVNDGCNYKAGTEFDPTGRDGCGTLGVLHNYNGGGTTLSDTLLPVGIHVITWTVTDGFNSIATCPVTIRVDDAVAPVITCKTDTTLYLDESGSVAMDAKDLVEVTNECASLDKLTYIFEAHGEGIHSYVCSDTAGVKSETIRVTDFSGNSVTCQVPITVKDTLPPYAELKDGNVILLFDASGTITLTPQYIIDHLFNGPPVDNCTDPGMIDISSDPGMFTIDDMGSHDVVVLLKDLSGNTYSVTVRVIVENDVSQRETVIEKCIQDKHGDCQPNSKANVGDIVTFVIKVANEYGGDRNLVIVDSLPEGLSVVDVPGNSSIDLLTGRVVTIEHGPLAPEESRTYVITARVEQTGTFVNHAYLYREDERIGEAAATVLALQPELVLTARVREGDYTNTEASPSTYNVPSDYRLIVRLENTGGAIADRPIKVQLTYNPDAQRFVGSSRGGDVTDNSGTITWTISGLAGLEELELSFVPRIACIYTFEAEVDILAGENPTDNFASVTVNQAIIKVPNVVTSDHPELHIRGMHNESITGGTMKVVNTWGNQVSYVHHEKDEISIDAVWFNSANISRGTYWYELVVRYENGMSYVIRDYVEVLK